MCSLAGDLPDDALGDRVELHGGLARWRRAVPHHVLLQDLRAVLVQLRARVHQHRPLLRRAPAHADLGPQGSTHAIRGLGGRRHLQHAAGTTQQNKLTSDLHYFFFFFFDKNSPGATKAYDTFHPIPLIFF